MYTKGVAGNHFDSKVYEDSFHFDNTLVDLFFIVNKNDDVFICDAFFLKSLSVHELIPSIN